jgi:uracil-DNA glycosylase family 4
MTYAPVPHAHLMPSSNPINQYTDFFLSVVESDCQACGLGATRQNFVVGKGSPLAKLLFLGEGPGEKEDQTGLPFVGAAGKLLHQMLDKVGITLNDCFIMNTIFCRPPGNRNPYWEEQVACRPHLDRLFEIIKPKTVVALGRVPGEYLGLLQANETMRPYIGKWKAFPDLGYKATLLYHPSYLKRPNGHKEIPWMEEILQQIKEDTCS